MVNTIARCFLLLLLLLPVRLFGAETVKVRYVASVYADSKDVALKVPQGVGCTGKVLIVADTENDRLVRFTLEQGAVTGGDEWKIPEVSGPIRVQVDSKGGIFVLDGRKLRIARLSPDGNFKGNLDLAGMPGASTVVPGSFKVDGSDNVYVLDLSGGRVIVFDAAGKYVRQVPFPEEYGFISDVAVDSRGTVYLLDSVNAVIYSAPKEAQAFSSFTKGLREHVKFPTDMVIDSGGNIFVVDHNGGVIAVVGPNGTFQGHAAAMGWKEGQLRFPAQICVNEKGQLFVADKSNSRIEMFEVIK